ncbi:MAG: HAD-IIIA family hydrolase, partial [Candidatus Firestonebacteria bacterium]
MRAKIVRYCYTAIEYSLYGFALTAFWAWSAMQLFFAFALAAYILKTFLDFKPQLKKTNVTLFDAAFMLMILFSFISCFFGVNPSKSFGQHAFIKTTGWMLLYIVARSSFADLRQVKRTVWLLIWSALIGGIFAVAKGIYEHQDKFTGGLGHWIQLGMGMNFALALITAIFFYRMDKKSSKEGRTWALMLLIPAAVACFAALIGSNASSALVALAILVLVFLLIFRKTAAFTVVAVVLVVFLAGIYIVPNTGFGRSINKITNLKHQSVSERLCMWKSGVNIIKDHPAGIGIDNMSLVYPKYMLPEAKEGNTAHLHNNFVQLAAERGIETLLAYFIFIIAFYMVSIKALHKISNLFERYLVAGIIGVFTVLVVSGIFEYSWGTSQTILNFWFLSGLGMAVVSKHLSGKRAAVFLDRDGTINVEKEYLSEPKDLKLIRGAAEGIKILNDAGYLAIVTTNQSGVGRGLFTEKTLKKIHAKLVLLLERKDGARLDSIVYCKHSPDAGCDCRKPLPGMINKAAEDFNVNIKKSYVVGDKKADIEFGKKAGAKTILVLT